ncbi:hypothetical protein TWF281_008003, partial [Arthrobotrys megalospora]
MALGQTQPPCEPRPMDLDIPPRPAPLIPVKRKRAAPKESMEQYKEEMRFYYITLNYTVKQVMDTMESHYSLGAS